MLRLVAEGLTNKEIAQRLIVTENTVKTHVTSLFNKLGVDSRACGGSGSQRRTTGRGHGAGLCWRLTGR